MVGAAQHVGERVENGGFHFGRQFRRLPHRANFACGAVAIALVHQHTREREPANRAGRFLADEAAHRGTVVPLLPQPCLGAPAQQRHARPIGIGAKEGDVALESCRAIRVAQQCPFDQLCATGSLIDAASAVASFALPRRASSIACFAAARSGTNSVAAEPAFAGCSMMCSWCCTSIFRCGDASLYSQTRRRIGGAKHTQGRSKQANQGTSMQTSIRTREVQTLGPISTVPARAFPQLHGFSSVPRSTPVRSPTSIITRHRHHRLTERSCLRWVIMRHWGSRIDLRFTSTSEHRLALCSCPQCATRRHRACGNSRWKKLQDVFAHNGPDRSFPRRRCRGQDRLHRTRQSLGEWLLRKLQWKAA